MNTTKSKLYNGHESYITSLGKFVAIYEIIIKKATKTEDFENIFPKSYKMFCDNIKAHVKRSSCKELPEKLGSGEITLAFSGSKNVIFDLCRHIRNSFCHMLLTYENDKLNIIDISRGRKTSDGWLNKNTLLSFIKSIIKEYETKTFD